METIDLESVLRKCIVTNHFFQGVHSADNVKYTPEDDFPQFCIVNTDLAKDSGEHWLVFYFPRLNAVEVFDSMGMAPYAYPNLINFFNTFDGKVFHNNAPVQGDTSNVCGVHCLFFVFKKIVNNNALSMKQIIKKYYTTDVNLNDCMVMDFLQKHFDVIQPPTIKRLEKSVKCKSKK